jgi:hypothetical protein
LDRRQVLAAIAAVGSGLPPLARAADPAPGLRGEAAAAIGRAYLAAHPAAGDRERLAAELLPHGWSAAAARRLRARAAADFRAERLFLHQGWRLSDTEGRLFALAALT